MEDLGAGGSMALFREGGCWISGLDLSTIPVFEEAVSSEGFFSTSTSSEF
jgi:hypothetical protein